MGLYEYVLKKYPNCTFAQFKEAFNLLNSKYRKILKDAYGKNLTETRNLKSLTNEEKRNYNRAKRQLLIYVEKIISNKKVQKRASAKYLYIYVETKVPGITRKIMMTAFETLNTKYKEVLFKAYGNDLNNQYDLSGFSKEESRILMDARKRLVKACGNLMKNKRSLKESTKYLFDYIKIKEPKCSYDDFMKAFALLNDKYKAILKQVYGIDLSKKLNLNGANSKLVCNARKELLKYVIKIVNNQNTRIRVSTKFLYKYIKKKIPECTFNTFQQAFKKMSLEYQKILKLAYGVNLDQELKTDNLTDDQKKKLIEVRRALLSKIKHYMKNNPQNSKNTLYSCLSDYSEEEVDALVLTLSLEVQSKLIYYFGYGYDNPRQFLNKEEILEKSLIIYMLRLLLLKNKPNDEIKEWTILARYFDTPKCHAYINSLSLKQQLIIGAKLGTWDGKVYSFEELAKVFDLKINVLMMIANQIILDLRNIVSEEIKENNLGIIFR